MAYVCDLGTGQRVYLDNQGMQTVVTTVSTSPGQQQQSSNSFSTGNWTAPPELFQTANGVIVKINTAGGDRLIQIQGNSISVTSSVSSLSNSQQLQMQQVASTPASSMPPMQPMAPMKPLEPIKPMEPMKMGDMQMNLNPMEMRMGNMEMRMGSTTPNSGTRRFCSQCGAPVEESDRFCSSCGHKLN
jgi:NADH pyrophosphatase NudC (nudix superfamily)